LFPVSSHGHAIAGIVGGVYAIAGATAAMTNSIAIHMLITFFISLLFHLLNFFGTSIIAPLLGAFLLRLFAPS
jgi:hypothetical protein